MWYIVDRPWGSLLQGYEFLLLVSETLFRVSDGDVFTKTPLTVSPRSTGIVFSSERPHLLDQSHQVGCGVCRQLGGLGDDLLPRPPKCAVFPCAPRSLGVLLHSCRVINCQEISQHDRAQSPAVSLSCGHWKSSAVCMCVHMYTY